MTAHCQALADRFQQASDAFAAEVAALSQEQWSAWCVEEECTVAALAAHVAWGYEVEIDAIRAMATGSSVPTLTEDDLDQMNVAAGQTNAACDQTATLALLRRNAAAATTTLRSFTNEHLARTGCYLTGEPAERVDVWIEEVLIAHPGMHLPAIRSAARVAAPGRVPQSES